MERSEEMQGRIGALALDPPVRLAEDTTVAGAAQAMEDAGLSCVLIGGGAPRLVTDHDLALAVAAGVAPGAPVMQVATREPVWATMSTTVADAAALMTGNGIRHLVVIAPDGEVAGILSLLAATRALLEWASPLTHARRT